MLSSLFLALREGVEAALVIAILLGAVRKVQRPELAVWVWWGVISALGVSLLATIGLRLAGAELEGPAEVIYEGSTLLVAATLLTWMIFWMHRQSRLLKGQIESKVRLAVGQTGIPVTTGEPAKQGVQSGRALFGVAFLAVIREGVEMALLITAAGLISQTVGALAGVILGLAGAVAVGWVIVRSTRRLPLGTFFQITNIFLILFAAGLVVHGVGEFNEIGWIPTGIEHLYNLSPVLSEGSLVGQVFGTLLGYTASPSLTQVIAYLAYFAVILFSLFGIRAFRPARATS